MKKILPITITALSAMFILASCGESVKTVSPTEGYFTIELNTDYQDVTGMKDFVIAERLPGTDPNNLILLQARKGNIADDLLYSVRLQLPEGIVVTKDEYEDVMNEQMENIPEIKSFKALPVKNEASEVAYAAETTTLDGRPYYEYCLISLEDAITSVCLGTSRDPKAAEKAINSVQFAHQ